MINGKKKFVPFGNEYQLSWGYYRGDRIGLYCFNNKEDVGYVDVDFLNYDYASPSHTTTTGTGPLASKSPDSTHGMMLGSWKTQVQFDDVKVQSGITQVFSDSFDTEQSAWHRDSGDWQVAGDVFRQISNATPALTTFMISEPLTNYTVSVRAKKTEGAEGFLVGFGVQDSENYYWLNLGGWNNSRHHVEKTMYGQRYPIGPAATGSIETGRWYDIKIEVESRRIRCFLDRQQILDLTDAGFADDSAALPADNDKLNFGRAIIPDMVADPSIVDIDGTFYCYATTDGWGQGLSTSGTPVVWTSKDFLNWSFEGSSFPSDFDLKYWAPSTIVHRNGRYYSFPTLDGKITAVAADSPLGPFAAPDGQRVTRPTLQPFPIEQKSTIDAEVFIDDDGQAYMVWSRRRMVKLKPDLLSPDGPMITIPTKRDGYSEGPFLTKRNGIYYYFYTLGGDEKYQYAYMMSRTSPLGPWETPEQDLISTTDHANEVFGPGHGCFFSPEGSDQWYFVYLEYGRGGTRWLAATGDSAAWFQVDLGAPHDIRRTEVYFVKPAAGHAYRLEWSLDGQSWQPYGGHDEVIFRSPHRDEKSVRARYLKLTILNGEPGLWEFRVY